MLKASGLRKVYGPTVAVAQLDLHVAAGSIVGLVGNNGAGKSTTIKMLCGLLEPTQGNVLVAGKPVLDAATRSGIGYVPEDSPLYDDQTPLEYLAFFARLYGLPTRPSKDRAQALLRRLRLDEQHWRKPIGQLSKGSARKVALARALLHDPAVLVLDEPASGLDPATRRELDQFLHALRGEGKAILLSAHHLRQVEELCDAIVLLHEGKVAAQGTLAQLRTQWGEPRYRLHATVPFAGSSLRGAIHVGNPESPAQLEAAMATIRAGGGAVLEVESMPPTLEEILAKAAGA